jgi:hypothetical protein
MNGDHKKFDALGACTSTDAQSWFQALSNVTTVTRASWGGGIQNNNSPSSPSSDRSSTRGEDGKVALSSFPGENSGLHLRSSKDSSQTSQSEDEDGIPVFPSNRVIKEGYLTKRGQLVESWKKRYFTCESETVKYYEKKPLSTSHIDSVIPAGEISLTGSKVALCDQVKAEYPFCFSITELSGKIVLIACRTARHRQEWIGAMMR